MDGTWALSPECASATGIRYPRRGAKSCGYPRGQTLVPEENAAASELLSFAHLLRHRPNYVAAIQFFRHRHGLLIGREVYSSVVRGLCMAGTQKNAARKTPDGVTGRNTVSAGVMPRGCLIRWSCCRPRSTLGPLRTPRLRPSRTRAASATTLRRVQYPHSCLELLSHRQPLWRRSSTAQSDCSSPGGAARAATLAAMAAKSSATGVVFMLRPSRRSVKEMRRRNPRPGRYRRWLRARAREGRKRP